MSAFLSLLKAFLVDLLVTAGAKIIEKFRKGPKHSESYSDGTTEDRLKKKIDDQGW